MKTPKVVKTGYKELTMLDGSIEYYPFVIIEYYKLLGIIPIRKLKWVFRKWGTYWLEDYKGWSFSSLDSVKYQTEICIKKYLDEFRAKKVCKVSVVNFDTKL